MQNACNNSISDDFYTDFENDMRETYGGKCADDVQEIPEVDVNSLVIEDFTEKNDIYKSLLNFDNTIELEEFVNSLRQRAKQLKCKTDFETRLKPYLKTAQQSIRELEKFQKQAEKQSKLQDFPPWFDGEHILDDVLCEEILKNHEYRRINNKFYDINGFVADEVIEQRIYNRISLFISTKTADVTRRIFNALKIKSYMPAPPADFRKIHLKNGTLTMGKNGKYEFSAQKEICLNRLNVEIKNGREKSPTPKIWLNFLNDLLCESDIPCVQEYGGYCFVPTTDGQKMLFLVGDGGEGKSRIPLILQGIIGDNSCSQIKLKDLANDNFQVACLDGKLLNTDDDVTGDKLAETSLIKELISAKKMHLNPKHEKPFDTVIFCHLIACGNNLVTALYDHTNGFYRRQIIIKVKPTPKNRIKINSIDEKILDAEKESVFWWFISGLERLIANNFEFSISDNMNNNLAELQSEDCNVSDFLESGYDFIYDTNSSVTCKYFYDVYQLWARDNALIAVKDTTFFKYIKSNAEKFGFTLSRHIKNHNGKSVRGYKGIRGTNSHIFD